MANLNLFIEENYLFKFRELKTLLKCKTNAEALKNLIDIVQQHLQQQAQKDINPNINNPPT